MTRTVLCIAAFCFLSSIAFAQDVELPDGKAKKLVQSSCSECHGLDQVVSNPQSRDEWRSTVQKMVRRGATLSPEQINDVVDYLAVYFAPDRTNVNTASAPDLQTALGITQAQAQAVVDYRAKNGKIADLAMLAKAAGVDSGKLDAKKDSITF